MVVQTRNMIKAQNIAATENTSVQASSSALPPTKPIKTPKTDVVKNQNSPENELPDNNQDIPSVSHTQTHPLDLSLSTQSSKFGQSSKSAALNPSVSDYVECDLPQVISTPNKDRLKSIADLYAPKFDPSIDKDNDQKDIQPPNNISPDKNSVSKISDSASSSNIHSTGKYLKPKTSIFQISYPFLPLSVSKTMSIYFMSTTKLPSTALVNKSNKDTEKERLMQDRIKDKTVEYGSALV